MLTLLLASCGGGAGNSGSDGNGGGGGSNGAADWPANSKWASLGISGGLSLPSGTSVLEVEDTLDAGGSLDIALSGNQSAYENLKTQLGQKTGVDPVSYTSGNGAYAAFTTDNFIYVLAYTTEQGQTLIGIGIEPISSPNGGNGNNDSIQIRLGYAEWEWLL
jgi:hypothetical protein